MLNGNDLRNSVTAMETTTTTTTTTTKMPSAHNLKTRPQTPSNPKESNTASSTKTVFQCLACQKEFVTEKYLCMHMALHRTAQGVAAANAVASSSASSSSPSTVAASPGSAKLMDPRTAIQKSSSSPSSDGSIKLIKSDGNGASHWTCKICSKTFAQSSNYKNHIRTHSDERPFVCNICSIGFKERYHLKKHILFKHSDELKEECRVCGKRFKDSTAVRAHERIHSEDRPYGCQRCDKTFKTSECLWHHENRSRTCGKLLRAAAAAGGGGGGAAALVDSNETNPGPRFRRGRHPSKRLAMSKAAKAVVVAAAAAAAAAAVIEDGPMGDASAGLTLDHVEEISASVKIELEREIPDYYFRSVPGFCSYEFETMSEVLASDTGSMLPNGLHSVRPTDGLGRAIDPNEVNRHRSSLGSVVATVTTKSPLDQFASSYWGSGDWSSSSSAGAGVLLGSPSRPVSASYDMIGDAYCPETADDSWKQDACSSGGCHGIYVAEMTMTTTTTKSDFVKSQTVIRYPPRSVLQMQQLQQQQQQQQQLQQQQQQLQQLAPCSYAGDYRPTANKASQSMMGLAGGMTETQWPPVDTSTADSASSSSSTRIIVDNSSSSISSSRSAEFSSTIACTGSYPASIAGGVPTAVVAPFKRENTNRPLEVSISEAEQQPVKNSLPPFETFAPMTLRAQKSKQAAAVPQRASPPPPSPPPPPDVRFIPPFANPYSFDNSVADQCPTIQKYLLKGHPNAPIKISHNLLLPGEQQGQSLCHLPFNRQYYRLSPRDHGRHPDGVASGLFVPLEGGGGGGVRQQPAPEEFRAAFLSETWRMRPGGGAAAATGGQLGGLVSSSPLPARISDATGAVNFVQMTSPPLMLSTSQSAMLQRLSSSSSNIADTTNAMSVDIYQQI